MSKTRIEYERRMYAGCSVFIVSFWDTDNNRFNYTTMSSIYVLGKMIVLGSANNNMLKCIQETKKFGINFLSEEYLDDMMIGSESSKDSDLFSKSNLSTKIIDEHLAIIEESQLSYCCNLNEVYSNQEFPDYYNVIGSIKDVFVDNKIIKDEKINVDDYTPIIFVGTDEGRFFKNLSDIEK